MLDANKYSVKSLQTEVLSFGNQLWWTICLQSQHLLELELSSRVIKYVI